MSVRQAVAEWEVSHSPMVTRDPFYIGVDIGGSSVKVGIVSPMGHVASRSQTPVNRDDGPDAVVHHAKTLVEALLKEINMTLASIGSVGIACPGLILQDGVVHAAHNFPTWKDVPLKKLFEAAIGKPAHLCNDADAAVLAEQWVGSAKNGVRDFVMLTLGTGVGCGIIVNGQLVRGGTNTIEGGHMIIERNGRLCGCTQRGCLEAYSSATALVTEAQEHLSAGADSALSAYPLEEIDAKLIFKVAADGDPMCNRLIQDAADYLGFACVTFCRILDPQMIVLAGGMAEAGEMFVDLVRSSYAKYSWTSFPNPVVIEKASAGYDSGIIGAAAIARHH